MTYELVRVDWSDHGAETVDVLTFVDAGSSEEAAYLFRSLGWPVSFRQPPTYARLRDTSLLTPTYDLLRRISDGQESISFPPSYEAPHAGIYPLS